MTMHQLDSLPKAAAHSTTTQNPDPSACKPYAAQTLNPKPVPAPALPGLLLPAGPALAKLMSNGTC